MYMGIYTVASSLPYFLKQLEQSREIEMKEITTDEGDKIKKVPSCDDLKQIAISIKMIKE